MFQSRNRGSFDFKPSMTCRICGGAWMAFQSRNRGSFDFKQPFSKKCTCGATMFQSRNRGSFDFKAN